MRLLPGWMVLAFVLLPGLALGQAIGPGSGPSGNVAITGGTISGADVGGAVSTATGGNLPLTNSARFAQQINAKDYAAGDSATYTNGTVAAGGNVITSTSRSCVAADIGKAILLHGSGAAGAPQQGTVVACSGSGWSVSFTAVLQTPWNGLWSGTVSAPGTGYAPGNTLTMTGGTQILGPASWTIVQTKAVSASVVAGGSGGTAGACTVTGTTGATALGVNGSKFSATGTVSGGSLSGALVVTVGGNYTTNPTTLTAEPVTGCNLTGATVSVVMGAGTLTVANNGSYSSLTASPVSTSSGSGSGATVSTSGYRAGGSFTIGTDDTAGFAAALAAASAAGKQLRVPAGSYWLASQVASMPLANTAIVGDGQFPGATPSAQASVLLISNTATAAFALGQRATMQGMVVQYPAQDDISVTPPVFPPLFEGSLIADVTLSDNIFFNPYILLKVDAGTGSALGRVAVRNNRAYCVFSCLYFLGGAADILNIDSMNFFTVGEVSDPTGYFNAYTSVNGEWMHVDIGAAPYTLIDGLLIAGAFVHGYNYGIRILSGTIDVSTLIGTRWEVSTILSVEGAGQWSGNSILGGYAFQNPPDPMSAPSVISFNSSGTSNDLYISGFAFNSAYGNWINWSNAAGPLTVTNVKFGPWGRSGTVGNYKAIYYNASGNPGSANVLVGNNTFSQISSLGSTFPAIYLSFAQAMVTGNNCIKTYICVFANGAAGSRLVASGNSSLSTSSNGLWDQGNGATVYDIDNVWDKASNSFHIGDQLSATASIVAHAGGGQTSATLLTSRTNVVGTVATAADSVKLPVSSPGMCVDAMNTAGVAMQVFGSGTDTINLVATATGVPVPAGKLGHWCVGAAGSWVGGTLN